MKILIITPRIPYPPYRGDKLKIFNITKQLLKRNQVKIISFFGNSTEIKDLEELRKNGIDAEVVIHSQKKAWLNMLIAFFTATPLQVSYYYSRKMCKKIHELSSKEKYDVIYFHLINSAQYFDCVNDSKALKVIDFTDATSLYLTRYVDFLKNPFRRLIFKWETKKVLNYEIVTQKFDTLFVCSNKDKEFLTKRNVHSNIQLLLNGIDLTTFKCETIEHEKERIIFAGNMSYFPNIDAVIYFTKEIFPLILAKIPNAKFYIVGQMPPPEVQALQSENIIVTGFVQDIRKEYLVSEVNIAPIRFGSGTLNKIIEAIALGIPTVATSLSVKGFPDDLKKYINTADSIEKFAQSVVEVLQNPEIRNVLVKEGIKEIRNTLSWDKIVEDFENYLNKRIKQVKV